MTKHEPRTVRVDYSRLFSFGQYENERIGMTVELTQEEKRSVGEIYGELFFGILAIEDSLQKYRNLCVRAGDSGQQLEYARRELHQEQTSLVESESNLRLQLERLKSAKSDEELLAGDERLCSDYRRVIARCKEHIPLIEKRVLEGEAEFNRLVKEAEKQKKKILRGDFPEVTVPMAIAARRNGA